MIRPLLVAAAAALALPVVQIQLDRRMGALALRDEALLLWRGDQIKRLFAGFEALAADVYWLRTVQYFGGQKVFSATQDFGLLKPLIEITTVLDPRLEIAYRYGAIFLCEPKPAGAGRPAEGIEILEKGVRALPSSWRLRQDLGFFHYIYGHDPERAAAVLTDASTMPGAPWWLEGMAADILAQGGDRKNARQMWSRMYEQAEGGIIKENARLRLQVLDAEEAAEALTGAVAEFARRFGRTPRRLDELRALEVPAGALVDPSGTPFEYDSQTGRVTVSQGSALWRPRSVQEAR